MDEEEDWDLPDKVPSKPPQQSNSSTPHQTLKITDGYKYSYEALSSPANIDDWVEGPSYGGSRRSSSGYSQNSFRDNKSFRNDRGNINKRFDSLRNNDSFSGKSSSRNFNTPKSNRFSNRSMPVPAPVNDWDAPDNSTDQINGSWKGNANISVNVSGNDENWDDEADSTIPQKSISNSVEIPMYNPDNVTQNNISNVANEEEDWDNPGGNDKTSRNPSQPTNGTGKSKFWDQTEDSSASNLDQRNSTMDIEENWDADPSDPSMSNTSRNGFAKDIPMYNPNNSNGQSYSNSPFNQRYENNYHSNKHPRSYESNDRFGREPFNRHSRGNRHNPYDRGGRGRGGRGGRGGRSGRDGYQSYNSRDNSRSRGDRRDGSYQHNSYSKNRNNDRTSYQSTPPSFSNIEVETEDWDSPTGFVQKSTENNAPPPPAPSSAPEEESWD